MILPILSPMKTLPHKHDPVVHQRFSLPGLFLGTPKRCRLKSTPFGESTYSPIFHGFHGGYITISPSNSHGIPTCTNYIPIRCSWYFPHISTISPLCSHPFPHEIAYFSKPGAPQRHFTGGHTTGNRNLAEALILPMTNGNSMGFTSENCDLKGFQWKLGRVSNAGPMHRIVAFKPSRLKCPLQNIADGPNHVHRLPVIERKLFVGHTPIFDLT